MESTLIVIEHKNPKPSDKIAAFDFDGTLVQKSFENRDDCSLMFSHVYDVLNSFHDAGFLICIISNQGEIGRATKTKTETENRVKNRFRQFLDGLNSPCLLIAATANDEFRKPNPGMWGILKDFCKPDKNYTESFFVGDAAGRKNDHSNSDIEFAKNCGIEFFDEIQFFRDHAYTKYVKKVEIKEELQKTEAFEVPKTQEIVFMVGLPASGKTTYSKKFEEAGYAIVHGDDHESKEARIKNAVKEILDQKTSKKSVVIDATNGTLTKREYYMNALKSYGLPFRAIYMSANAETCKARNKMREKQVPTIAISTCNKHLVVPTVAEGFTEVITI